MNPIQFDGRPYRTLQPNNNKYRQNTGFCLHVHRSQPSELIDTLSYARQLLKKS